MPSGPPTLPPSPGPPGPPGPPNDNDDDAMRAYLERLDLGHLELDEVELDSRSEPEAATDPLAWAQLALLAATLGWLAWFPSTVAYQRQGLGGWYLGCGGAVALALVLALRRWLWARVRQLRDRPADPSSEGRVAGLAARLASLQVPPRTLRWLMLGGALGLMALLLFVLPHDAAWSGHGYTASWFYAVLAAVVAGILLGRWLVLQAAVAAERDAAEPRPRVVLPPWFKWVTLAAMAGAGVVVVNGQALFGSESEGVGFGLGGAGFVLGIGMAIWLARRFDEMEQAAAAAAAAARDEALEASVQAAAAALGGEHREGQ